MFCLEWNKSKAYVIARQLSRSVYINISKKGSALRLPHPCAFPCEPAYCTAATIMRHHKNCNEMPYTTRLIRPSPIHCIAVGLQSSIPDCWIWPFTVLMISSHASRNKLNPHDSEYKPTKCWPHPRFKSGLMSKFVAGNVAAR